MSAVLLLLLFIYFRDLRSLPTDSDSGKHWNCARNPIGGTLTQSGFTWTLNTNGLTVSRSDRL